IIFGAVIDDSLGDEVRVTVIAAGFDGGAPIQRNDERALGQVQAGGTNRPPQQAQQQRPVPPQQQAQAPAQPAPQQAPAPQHGQPGAQAPGQQRQPVAPNGQPIQPQAAPNGQQAQPQRPPRQVTFEEG